MSTVLGLTKTTDSPTAKKGSSTVALVHIWQNAPAVFVAVICLYFFLIITGIILNGLVCYVMIKSKRYLKNVSCFFITHMAAVDLFCRVVFTPLVVYMSLPAKKEQSPIPCKISAFVSSSCAAAIFGSLVVIAIDRYHNIIHPLTSLKRQKRPFLIGSLVWIYSVASSVMFLFTARNVPLDDLPEAKDIERVGNPTSCDIVPGSIGGLSVTVSAVMIFVIPLVILIIAYTAITLSLRRRCQSGLVHAVAAKAKVKAVRMLVLVVTGFVVSFGPTIVVQTLRSYKVFENTDSESLVITIVTTDILQFCSSLCNPLIYAFYSDGFKKDLLKSCAFCVKCTLSKRKVASLRNSKTTTPNFVTTSL